MSHIVVNPEADLAARAGDERLGGELLEKLQLFATLKKKPSFEKFPNSVVLRHYRPGEIVCRQGDAGASAYYILTVEDLLALGRPPSAADQVERLAEQSQPLAGTPAKDARRQRLTAHLLLSDGKPKVKRGWLGAIFGGSTPAKHTSPTSIAIDGPSAIDMATRRAPLFEGEVFGEMSCMTMSPRSATVVADTDCYLLEFLRNIFDHIQRDAGYQQRLDVIYRERVLANHLKRLDLLANVPDGDLELLQQNAELKRVEPGQIIFDQGDVSDAVYLIRSGLVQVVTDPHLSLRVDDALDWAALTTTLLAGSAPGAAAVNTAPASEAAPPAPQASKAAEMLAAMKAKKAAAEASGAAITAVPTPAEPPQPTSPAALLAAAKAKPPAAVTVAPSPMAHLWQAFDAPTQAAIRVISANPAGEHAAEKQAIVQALNACMRDRDWLTAKAISSQLEHADVAAQTRTFAKGLKGLQKDWTDLEVRVAGRIVLELLLGATLRRRPAYSSPPRVLSYLSRGDIFGEMGVLTDVPRTATCLAYDHPPDPGRSSVPVDLVRINSETFKTFVARSPLVQRRVEAILAERRAKDQRRAAQPQHETHSSLGDSPDFQELGLIQGQKLLLIDLDRCTRCGDCVRACVATHDDGRSRLYLDGPRFDRYLVPSACRNCLNPACMIGCPVGAIQRGDDGQIQIRDWCIGCNMCAEQCPYDSIQMHDLGLVPARMAGWRVAPTSIVRDASWTQPKFRDGSWPLCTTPLDWNLELQSLLRASGVSATSLQLTETVCFRLAFDVDAAALGARHELSLVTQGSAAQVWLNGQPLVLETSEKRHRDKAKKNKGRWYEGPFPAGRLRRRGNVLAIEITGPVAAGEGVLDVEVVPGAGELSLPGGVAEVKQVVQRAVVCDLCSTLPTGPACVTMCPHDAAFRVDARVAFPGA